MNTVKTVKSSKKINTNSMNTPLKPNPSNKKLKDFEPKTEKNIKTLAKNFASSSKKLFSEVETPKKGNTKTKASEKSKLLFIINIYVVYRFN